MLSQTLPSSTQAKPQPIPHPLVTKPVPQVHRLSLDTCLTLAWKGGLRGVGRTYDVAHQVRGSHPKFIGVIVAGDNETWQAIHYQRSFTKDSWSDVVTPLPGVFDSPTQAAEAILNFCPSQAELEADITAQAEEVAPEPEPTTGLILGGKYNVTVQQEVATFWFYLWDMTQASRPCIGSFCKSLSQNAWVINSRIDSSRRSYPTALEAQTALVKLWEADRKRFADHNAKVLQSLMSA